METRIASSLSPEQAIVQQLHNLRPFIAVAESGSVSRAAEQLFKAPSAITRSIIELERALGLTLFERRPRGMMLNAFGEAVLVRARRVRDEIDEATEQFIRNGSRASRASASAVSAMLFNSRKLDLIIQLASLRNVSSAAAKIDMSQSGASMALSRIEAAIGQPIFERRMEGMVATDAAEKLVTHAKRVFAELRHLGSDLSVIAGNLSGFVVIGTTPLGRSAIFTDAIAAASAQHPDLCVITVENSYELLVRDLRSGEVDFVLGVLRPPHLCHGLTTEALFPDRLSVFVRAEHPLAKRRKLQMAEILDERWILPRPNSLARPMIDASFKQIGHSTPMPTVETGDLAIIRQLLEASDMLAVTSPYQLMFELRAGSVAELPVTLPSVKRDVGLIMREGALLSPASKTILEAVRAQAHLEHNGSAPPP